MIFSARRAAAASGPPIAAMPAMASVALFREQQLREALDRLPPAESQASARSFPSRRAFLPFSMPPPGHSSSNIPGRFFYLRAIAAGTRSIFARRRMKDDIARGICRPCRQPRLFSDAR